MCAATIEWREKKMHALQRGGGEKIQNIARQDPWLKVVQMSAPINPTIPAPPWLYLTGGICTTFNQGSFVLCLPTCLVPSHTHNDVQCKCPPHITLSLLPWFVSPSYSSSTFTESCPPPPSSSPVSIVVVIGIQNEMQPPQTQIHERAGLPLPRLCR